MAFEITEKLKVVNPNASADKQEGPYASIQDALTATANLREVGRTVIIVQNPIYDSSGLYFIGGQGVEYWFNNGIEDSDLVLKNPTINHTGLFVNYTAPYNAEIESIQNFINGNNRTPRGSFTVTETTKPVYIQSNRSFAGGSSVSVYAFIGGTGIWGNTAGGGTAVTASMFKLLSTTSTTIEDITNDPNTRTISLGELSDGDYVTAANSVTRDLSNDELIYYFSYTQDGVLYLVQFIGDNGTYGGSGTQLVTGDFATSTNSDVTPAQDLESVLALGNTANNSINLIAPSGKTIITTGAVNVLYTGGLNTVSGTLDTSGLTLKTSPTGVQGKIGSNNLTGTAKFYELPNSLNVNNTLALGVSINGATAVTAGTNGIIPLTISGGGVTQGLSSVLSTGNTSGGTDIIMTQESGVRFESGLSSLYARFNLTDNFTIESSQNAFQWLYNGNYRNIGRTIDGEDFDVDGDFDLSGHLSGQFIPISGTTEDYPVTGNLRFDDGYSARRISKTTAEEDILTSIDFNDTSIQMAASNTNESETTQLTIRKNEISVASNVVGSNGLVGSQDFTPIAKLNPLAYLQTKGVKELVSGHKDIPDDFYIACTYQSDPAIRGRYLTYKTDTYRTFDLAPYIPDFVEGKIFSTNGIEIVDKNTIILSGQLTGTTGNLFTLVLKGSHINDNKFTVESSEFKELPDILRDNSNEPSKIQLAGYSRGFYYFVCRSTSQTPAIPTQVIKINPFNLSQIKIVSLPATSDFLGTVQSAQVYDGNVYFLSTSNTVAAKFIRVGENLDDPEVLFTANNPGANERVFRSFPFVIYNGKVFVPTIQNTSSGTSKIGLSSYDLAKKVFLNSVPTQTINSTVVGSPNYPYPHWMTAFGGKIFIHTAANNANQSRSLIRFDPTTLLVEASTPVPFRITDDNTISNDGFIYLNPEAQSDAYLLTIKADFENNETFEYVNEGAATLGYYSLGSPSNLVYAENFKTKLSEFYDDYPLKTINGESIKGIGDIVVSGGGGTTYTGTAPVNITGSVISVLTDTTPTASSTNLVNSGNLLTALNLKGTLTGTNAWSGTNTFTGVFTAGAALRASADNTIDIGSTTLRFGKIFTNMMQATAYRPSTSTGTLSIQSFTGTAWVTWATTGVGTFAFSPIVPTPTASGEATNKGYVDGLNTRGTNTQSGTGGSTLVYNIPHGLGVTPTYARADAKNSATAGIQFVTWDATNIIITYSVAPASGTNNLSWGWIAYK